MPLVQAQAYRDQYGMNTIHLMPANLYGPGENFNPESFHVIPALIKKFMDANTSNAESAEIWGSGKATREFLYTDDSARGIVMAADLYDGDQPINLGAGSEISIIDLARTVADQIGFTGEKVLNTNMPDGQRR